MMHTASDATPYVFPASQGYRGNDGSWSTFIVRAGQPAQDFEVLPSTSGVNVIVPLIEGCVNSPDNITAPANCGSLRGAFPSNNHQSSGFMTNSSSTWRNIGIFDLNLGTQYDIDINARYGYETIGLAVEHSGGPTLDGQVVAGIARKQFFLGVFPLGIKPTNFSTFDDPQPSYLTGLKDKGIIPGLGFGYTAGAGYRYRGITASLVLGGYDASRYDMTNSKTFQFGYDDNADFTIGLQNVIGERTLHGTVTLLNDGIVVNIDSTLPYLWLPEEVCDTFQKAFGLSYDENTQLYLVDDTIHNQLKQLNPTVSLTLGDGTTAGTGQNNTVVISLPYAAFDLQASWPLTKNTTNYFPLKRATNSTQYTLGRAFLQEAYVQEINAGCTR
ncbi:hypothetical protein SLS55_010330 [Diplodia seriata]|uniref:Peptidase A1 domain-containing protein n=1 Tax=Diplodia seriata TaxID=420778 RepID=A0ABR3BYA0_9PEZI